MGDQILFVAAGITGAVGLVWGGLWWWSVRGSRAGRQSALPRSVWDKLCRAHDLSAEDAQRLEALSQGLGPGERLLVFVDPRILSEAGDRAQGGEYVRIGQQLFGEAFGAAR